METWGPAWALVGLAAPVFIQMMNSKDPKVVFRNLERLSWGYILVGLTIVSWFSFIDAMGSSLTLSGFILLGDGAILLIVLRFLRLPLLQDLLSTRKIANELAEEIEDDELTASYKPLDS